MLEAFFFLNQSKLSIVIPIFHIVFSHCVGKLVFVKGTFFLGNIYDVMCQDKQTNKTLLHKKKSRQQGRLFPQPVTKTLSYLWKIVGAKCSTNNSVNFAVILWLDKCEKEKESQISEVSAIVYPSLSLSLSLCLYMPSKKFPDESSVRTQSSRTAKDLAEVSSDSINLHIQK